MDYRIDFGNEFAQYEWEIEAKGWFDARVKLGDAEFRFSFYDPVRLAQEVEGAIAREGFFFEKNVVVVPKVNRVNMEKAMKIICAIFKTDS